MGNECCTTRKEEKPLNPSRSNSLKPTPGAYLTPRGPELTPTPGEPLPVTPKPPDVLNDPKVIESETSKERKTVLETAKPSETQGRGGERRSFGVAMRNEWCMIRDKTGTDGKSLRVKSLPRSSEPTPSRNRPTTSQTPRYERKPIDPSVFKARKSAPNALSENQETEKAAFRQLDASGSRLLEAISALLLRVKTLISISAEKLDVQGWDQGDFLAYSSFLSRLLKRVLTLLKRPEVSYPKKPLSSDASYEDYESRIRELEGFLSELRAVRTPNQTPDLAWFLVIRIVVGRRGQLGEVLTSLGQFHVEYEQFSAQVNRQKEQLSYLEDDSEEVGKVLLLEKQIGELETETKTTLEGSMEVASHGELVLKALAQLEHLAVDVQTALRRDRELQAEKLNVAEEILLAPARQVQATSSVPEETTFSFDDLNDDQLDAEKTAFKELESSGSKLLEAISALLSKVKTLETITTEKSDAQEWEKENYPVYISFLSGLRKRALTLLKRPEIAFQSQPLASDASYDDYDSRIKMQEDFLSELRSLQTLNPTPDPAWNIVTRTMVRRKGELGDLQTSLGQFHSEFEQFSAKVRSQKEGISRLTQDSEEVEKVVLLEEKIGELENQLKTAVKGSLEVAELGEQTFIALPQLEHIADEVETALRRDREKHAQKATLRLLDNSGSRLLAAVSALLSRVKALRVISAEKADVQVWDQGDFQAYTSFLSGLRKRVLALMKRPDVAYPSQDLAPEASLDDYDSRIRVLEDYLSELRSVQAPNPTPDPAWDLVTRTMVERKGQLGDIQTSLGHFHTEYVPFSVQVRNKQDQLSRLSEDSEEVQKLILLEGKIGELEIQSKIALEDSLEVTETGELTLKALSQLKRLTDEVETALQRVKEEQAKKVAFLELDSSRSRLLSEITALLSRLRALKVVSTTAQEWENENYPVYTSFLSGLLTRALALLKRPEVAYVTEPLTPGASSDDYHSRILLLEEFLSELRSIQSPNPTPEPNWLLVTEAMAGKLVELRYMQGCLGRFHTDFELFAARVRNMQTQLSSVPQDIEKVQSLVVLAQKIRELESQSKAVLEGSLEVAVRGELVLKALSQIEQLAPEVETALRRDKEEQAEMMSTIKRPEVAPAKQEHMAVFEPAENPFSFDVVDLHEDELEIEKVAFQKLDISGSRLLAAISALLLKVKSLRGISAEKSALHEWENENYQIYTSFLSGLLKRALVLLKRPEVSYFSEPLISEASSDHYDTRMRILEGFLSELRSVQSPNLAPDSAWYLVTRTMAGRLVDLRYLQSSLSRFHTEYEPFVNQVQSQQKQLVRLPRDSEEVEKVVLLVQKIGELENQAKTTLGGSQEVSVRSELVVKALSQLEHLANELEATLVRNRNEQAEKAAFKELNISGSGLLEAISALLSRVKALRTISTDDSEVQMWNKESYPVYTLFLSDLRKRALALLKRPEVAYPRQPLASEASYDDYDSRIKMLEEFLAELQSLQSPNPTPDPAWHLVTRTMVERKGELSEVQTSLEHFHTEYEPFSAQVRSQYGQLSSLPQDSEEVQKVLLLAQQIAELENQSKTSLEGSLEVASQSEIISTTLFQIQDLASEVETALLRDREEQAKKAAIQQLGTLGSKLLAEISALFSRVQEIRNINTEKSTVQVWDKENYPVYISFLSGLLQQSLALLKRPEVAYQNQPLGSEASYDAYESRIRTMEEFLAELRSVQSPNQTPDSAWFLVIRTMVGRRGQLSEAQTSLGHFHTEYEPFFARVRSHKEQLPSLPEDSEEIQKAVLIDHKIRDLEQQSKYALEGSLEVTEISGLTLTALSQVEHLVAEVETELCREREEQAKKTTFELLDTSGSRLLAAVSALLSRVKALRVISAEKADVQVWDQGNFPAYTSFLSGLLKRALALLKRPEVAYPSQDLAPDASSEDYNSRIRELEAFLSELRSVQSPNPTPDPAWDLVTRTMVERKGQLGDIQTSLGLFHTEYKQFSAHVRSQQEQISRLPQDSDKVQRFVLLEQDIGDLENQSKTVLEGSQEVAAQGELTVQALSQLEHLASEIESALRRDREIHATFIEEIVLVPVEPKQASAPPELPSNIDLDLFQDQDRLLFLASIRPGILYLLSLKLPLASSETVELSDLLLTLSLIMQRHANADSSRQQIDRTVLEHFIENYRQEDVMMKLSAFLRALIVNSTLDYISLMTDLMNVHPPPYIHSPELVSSFSRSLPKAKDVLSPSSSRPEAWGETGGTIKIRTVLDLVHHMPNISAERGETILKICKPLEVSDLEYTKYILLFAFRVSSTESYQVSKSVFSSSSKHLELSEIVSSLHSLPQRHFLPSEKLSDLMTSFLAPGCKTLAQKEFTKNLVMNALVAADSNPAYVLPLVTFLRAFVVTGETESVEVSVEF